ncbi:MAG: nucleotidyltransferase domain-containing protein [Epsilonproteobacteria bacterium]|nr:MAG: nucleotidyltransferase domain-containing protein [Campylobacterota bacterium]
MIDIEELKPLIVEKLKPLNPDKIILFGSYAYGTPTEDSDIDLFLVKDDLTIDNIDSYELEASRNIRELVFKYKTGFDILSASTDHINKREDYFYKIDILQNGKVIYNAK